MLRLIKPSWRADREGQLNLGRQCFQDVCHFRLVRIEWSKCPSLVIAVGFIEKLIEISPDFFLLQSLGNTCQSRCKRRLPDGARCVCGPPCSAADKLSGAVERRGRRKDQSRLTHYARARCRLLSRSPSAMCDAHGKGVVLAWPMPKSSSRSISDSSSFPACCAACQSNDFISDLPSKPAFTRRASPQASESIAGCLRPAPIMRLAAPSAPPARKGRPVRCLASEPGTRSLNTAEVAVLRAKALQQGVGRTVR